MSCTAEVARTLRTGDILIIFLKKSSKVLSLRSCSFPSSTLFFYALKVYVSLFRIQSTEIKAPPEDPQLAVRPNGKLQHRRSGSHGDLSHIVRESKHVRTGSLSAEPFATPMSPISIHASRLLGRSGSRRRPSADSAEVYENGTSSSGAFAVQFLEENGTTDDDLVKREEAVTASVARALERGRKTVWELAARRVAALLSNDTVYQSSPHQFLQSLDWVNKFILAGEAFCGAEAVSLRTKLTKQSEQYFGAYHCQNLEVSIEGSRIGHTYWTCSLSF